MTSPPCPISSRATLLAVVVAALVAVSVGGCTTVDNKVRVIRRAGPVHDVAVIPAVSVEAIAVSAGADVLTDDELAALQARLPQVLQAAAAGILSEVSTEGSSARVGLTGLVQKGQLEALRVKVKASPGREQHRTVAECRLRIRVGDDVVAEVEGTTLQAVTARNLSVIELEGIRTEMQENGGRNPLLDVEDTERAIVSACTAALRAASFDERPGDADVDAQTDSPGGARVARKKARLEARTRALKKVETSVAGERRKHDDLAAALIDLGDSGGIRDAPVAAAYLFDEHPLVQRAASAAFVNLCAGFSILPAEDDAAGLCARPAPPAPTTTTPAGADDDDDDDGMLRGAPMPLLPDAPATETETRTETTPETTTTTKATATTDSTTTTKGSLGDDKKEEEEEEEETDRDRDTDSAGGP